MKAKNVVKGRLIILAKKLKKELDQLTREGDTSGRYGFKSEWYMQTFMILISQLQLLEDIGADIDNHFKSLEERGIIFREPILDKPIGDADDD